MRSGLTSSEPTAVESMLVQSVLRRFVARGACRIQQGFSERKFQNRLTGYIRYFQSGAQQMPGRRLAAEKITDRRARNFPRMVGISQLDPFRIPNEIVSDPGVEEVFRHRSRPMVRTAPVVRVRPSEPDYPTYYPMLCLHGAQHKKMPRGGARVLPRAD